MEDWLFALFVSFAFLCYAGVWVEDRVYRSRVCAHVTSVMTEVIRVSPEIVKLANAFSQPHPNNPPAQDARPH